MRFALAALTLAAVVAAKLNHAAIAKHSLRHHRTFNSNLRSPKVWAQYVRANANHARHAAKMMKTRAYMVAKYFAARDHVGKAVLLRNHRRTAYHKASGIRVARLKSAQWWSRRTAALHKAWRARKKAAASARSSQKHWANKGNAVVKSAYRRQSHENRKWAGIVAAATKLPELPMVSGLRLLNR